MLFILSCLLFLLSGFLFHAAGRDGAFQPFQHRGPFAFGNRRFWTGLPLAVHVQLHIQLHQTGVLDPQFLLIGEGFTQKRIRTRPARAAARAESQFIKAQADYQTRRLAQEQLEAFKSAAARLWHREKLKQQYRKQAREAAKQGAKAPEKTAAASEKLVEKAVGVVRRHPVGALLLAACVLLLVVMQLLAFGLRVLYAGEVLDGSLLPLLPGGHPPP
ncbi:hypothetical protein D5272_12220 [bacterium D16-76]|nr:hypothetical protein [bacterium D16-76]